MNKCSVCGELAFGMFQDVITGEEMHEVCLSNYVDVSMSENLYLEVV